MARQPPKSRYLHESSLSSDISMNKGLLSEICLIQETTLINLRRISLTVISLILLNFHFKCNKETLSIISRCWIFLMLDIRGKAESVTPFVFQGQGCP